MCFLILRRSLHRRVDTQAGLFWDNVTFTCSIDMRGCALPGVLQVQFSFMDPLYVWIQQATELVERGHSLVWHPRRLQHPRSMQDAFGAGIQYGLLLRRAKASIPQDGEVALMNLSWDGGGTGLAARSASPICIQVMNVNESPNYAVGLVGYLPHLEVSDAYLGTDAYKDAQFHLLQECVGKVVRCIEQRAEDGFRCELNGEKMLLFPRLGSMTLDTPERVKFFGLRSKRSCPYCRLRNGRSCARKATRQDSRLYELLMGWAQRPATTQVHISQRAKARKKLLHHGWNYKYKCRLLDVADKCLVTVFDRPFAGLIDYERMHTFFINYCTYAMELLAILVDPAKYKQAHESVQRCQQFRDPVSGRTHPRLASVLKMTHLTAERRVRAIFYWAHVLGTTADVIANPAMRRHAQIAVSTLQLLLIATRGHRAYTRAELDTIFLEVGREFFRALEVLAQEVDRSRILRGQEAHRRNPDRNRPPLPFKRLRRYEIIFVTCKKLYVRLKILYLLLAKLYVRLKILYLLLAKIICVFENIIFVTCTNYMCV